VTEQPSGGGAAFWAARGVRIEPEPDSDSETDPEPEDETATGSESGSGPETQAEAEAEVDAEAESDEPVAEAEPEGDAEPVAEAAEADEPEAEPEADGSEAAGHDAAEPEAPADEVAGPEADAAAAPVPGFPQQRAHEARPAGPAETAGPPAPVPSVPAQSAAATAQDALAPAGADPDAPPATDAAGEPVWQLTGGELANPLPPLKTCLEAILMVVDEPIPVVSLAQVLERPTAEVAEALTELAEEYTVLGRGFELREVGLAGDGSRTGWRVYSRADCAPVVERFVRDGQQAKLTQAALETLAVVAYRQPVSRSKVSAIRGVNCDGVMRTLLARGLVEEYGTDPESGALLYQTTGYFLERMGLKSLDELPDLAPLLPSAAEVDIEDFA
jgi:segregation and condensation protein B